jgi:uncharacterized repeat protein (TIGR01451 family)
MPSFAGLHRLSLHLVLIQSRKHIFCPKHSLFWRLKMLLFAGSALLLFEILLPQKAAAASCSTNTITRISAPGKFYIDSSPPSPLGMYVGYKITNNTGVAYSDLWVKLENFTGGVIGLGTNEDGIVHVGYLASGQTTTVYVYLKATGAPTGNANSTIQKHTVSLYSSLPNLATSLCGDEFSLVTEQTIQAQPNKVDSVISGPVPSALGGIVTLTVTGETGTLGANGFFVFSPASDSNWRANSYQLISSQVVLSGGNTGNYSNQLYLSGLNKENTFYTIVYTFVAVGATTTPTEVSPVNYIGSGNAQLKHNNTITTGSGAAFPPIQPADNTVRISSKTANPTNLPTGGVVDYTVTLANSSQNSAVVLDDIVDTLPANTSYVAGSAKFNGVSISNPAISGQTLTFRQLFSVPVINSTTGGTSVLTYKVTLPNTPGSYTNQVVGHIGDSVLIDTTLNITDNVPATASVTVGTPTFSISGTVFEDPNYGGGAGRPLGTAGTVIRPGAVVELYDSLGNFIATTTTDFSGKYSFTVSPGNFKVRVVNRTVVSSRSLTTPAPTDALLPVQTFRTDGSSGAAVAVVDRVGGEKPENSDPDVNDGTQTLAELNNITQSEVLSLTPVTVSTANINSLDFGFNFDTIVNTRGTGHGSLRQFVINSNAFTNTGLAQIGQTAGKEVSIFMIPLPTSLPIPAGLRTGITNQLNTAGVAVIRLASTLKITDTDTSIDGRTQTTNVGDSNSLTLGSGGNVGVGNLSLAKLNAPEIELINSGSSIIHGITVDGANTTIQGIAIHGFGTVGNNRGDILLQGANPVVTQNAIGFTAHSFTAPTANQSQSGIVINGSTNTTITNNIIGFTNERGILGGRTAIDLSGLVISENEIKQPGNISGTTGQHSAIELFPNTTGNISITRNLLTDSQADSGIAIRPAVSGTSSNFLVQNNSILRNGAGNVSGFGILLQAIGTSDLQGIKIDKNILNQNRRGIDSQQTAVTISGNTISNSLGGYGIAIEAGKQKNKITQNSIFGNVGVGIDLGNTANGITPNNGTLSTTISNQDIDYPLITSATLSGGTLTAKGYIGNDPAGNIAFSNLTLEFFIADNTPADQNGEVIIGDTRSKPHGEGKTYIGSCTTNASGIFGNSTNPCVFSNAGTLGLTAATNVTATATNSNGNTSEFSASPSSHANLVLVKRITAINSAATGLTTYDSYIHESGSTKDNDPGWPANYLLGGINPGQVHPGDEIEYTIYYLNNGENRISQAKVCDALNKNLDFVLNFNSSNTGKGILFSPSGITSTYLTNIAGDDRGEYSSTSPTDCNLVSNTTTNQSTNTIVVNAANSSNPILGGAYGSIKFKVKVKS